MTSWTKKLASLGLISAASVLALNVALADDGEVTLIHTGDIHGHMVPRPNVRSDSTGHLEGGLARIYTVINPSSQDSPRF